MNIWIFFRDFIEKLVGHVLCPIRVLHIVSSMDRGGAESLIMNIYRNLDRSRLQFDFITHDTKKGDYDDEIVALGGQVFHVPSLGSCGAVSYVKKLISIMSQSSYAAVHSHTDYQSGFPTLAAKLSGVPKRISHSHSTNWPSGNGMKARAILKLLRLLIKWSATDYCSCSIEAGLFLFGKNSRAGVINNGINVSEFTSISDNSKNSVLKELALPEDVILIGHVGRFSESKNHFFILKVLKKLIDEDENYMLLLVGDGPLKEKVIEDAEKLGILMNIRFLGVRTDIPRLMKAFDVFLFPSLFEGFGIVTLEAQSAGTPCVVADVVPKSTDMGLNLMTYISLEEGIDSWVEKIKLSIQGNKPNIDLIHYNFEQNGFDIKKNVPAWLSLYGVS